MQLQRHYFQLTMTHRPTSVVLVLVQSVTV